MHKAFVKHIAQMDKYNLYNDLQNKPLQYGQSIDAAVNYILHCDNTKKWFEDNCEIRPKS